MSQRLVREIRHGLPGIRERVVTEDGVVRFIKTQNAEPLITAIRARMDQPDNKRANMRYLGSIPMVLAQTWARECGFAIGTKGFQEYARKKLMDGEFAKLRGE